MKVMMFLAVFFIVLDISYFLLTSSISIDGKEIKNDSIKGIFKRFIVSTISVFSFLLRDFFILLTNKFFIIIMLLLTLFVFIV